MKTSLTDGVKSDSPNPFSLETGQFWEFRKGHIQIVEVGRLLVHFKHFKPNNQRAASRQLMSVAAMQSFLKDNKAKLLDEAPSELLHLAKRPRLMSAA